MGQLGECRRRGASFHRPFLSPPFPQLSFEKDQLTTHSISISETSLARPQWTGSTQFERDLRRHAERQGYKFDSGGIRTRETDRPVEAKSEEDVFRVLGLKYIP